MKLPGIVTNVTAFGVFVDVGVHQDGLVHISQISDEFVRNPADIMKVGQRVRATVLEVDIPRKRISLSLKTNPEIGPRAPKGAPGSGPGAGPRDVQRHTAGRNAPPAVDWFTAATQKKR